MKGKGTGDEKERVDAEKRLTVPMRGSLGKSAIVQGFLISSASLRLGEFSENDWKTQHQRARCLCSENKRMGAPLPSQQGPWLLSPAGLAALSPSTPPWKCSALLSWPVLLWLTSFLSFTAQCLLVFKL